MCREELEHAVNACVSMDRAALTLEATFSIVPIYYFNIWQNLVTGLCEHGGVNAGICRLSLLPGSLRIGLVGSLFCLLRIERDCHMVQYSSCTQP